MLLKSLIVTGALCGIILGSIGTSVPWSRAFSPDAAIIKEMHQVLIPYFITLSVTPSTSGLEGALLAVRDLKFISLSMSGIVSFGALLLLRKWFASLLMGASNISMVPIQRRSNSPHLNGWNSLF